MNIFYLDPSPTKSAQAMTDKHIVKMILESAQLLSTAHRVLDGEPYYKISKSGAKLVRYDHTNPSLYEATHINHPSAIWVRESSANYIWLYEHMMALGDEYTARYGKVHKSITQLGDALSFTPVRIPHIGKTPVRLAITNKKHHNTDPVVAYRNYYIAEKIQTDKDMTRYLDVLFGTPEKGLQNRTT